VHVASKLRPNIKLHGAAFKSNGTIDEHAFRIVFSNVPSILCAYPLRTLDIPTHRPLDKKGIKYNEIKFAQKRIRYVYPKAQVQDI
jgi:hypothetical protein